MGYPGPKGFPVTCASRKDGPDLRISRDHEGHEDIQGKEETEASRVLRGSRVQKEWMETRDRMDQLASR